MSGREHAGASPSPGGPVPVLVLAGFLGSGKTTLLNHLLRNANGVRLGVIVNDFGDVGIDALLVAGQVDGAVDLGGGCVCCAVDVGELDTALARLTTGPGAVDAVVIEASGLAEPRSLIRMIVASEVSSIRYGGLTEVVDAEAFERNSRAHPELTSHVRLADLVVLNKSDLVAEDDRDRLHSTLAALCAPAPVVDTAEGRVDPALLFDERDHAPAAVPRQMTLDELLRPDDADGAGHRKAGGSGGAHAHLHSAYSDFVYRHDGPLHPRRLADMLAGGTAGVYRMKGIVALGDPEDCGVFEVQTVGRYVHAQRTPEARRPDSSTIVAIGAGFDAAKLRGAFDACRVDDAEAPDPQALLGILRFCP